MAVHLRDYQLAAVDGVRAAMRRHRRVLLVSPTGSGKTVIFSRIAEIVYSRQGRVTIGAHRIEIVNQISRALRREGVTHGVVAPGHAESRARVQVGMIQTMANRLDRLERPELFVIDEAHHAVAAGYRKILEHWAGLFVLGVTATPARLDGKGLGDVFDVLVNGPSMRELQARGYLSRYRYFAPPVVADLTGLATRGGDYAVEQVAAAMDQRVVMGDAEKHYRQYLNGKPAIAFCATVEHAEHTAAFFRERGWKAAAVSGQSADRDTLLASIGDGRLNVLSSCDIISEGTDIPIVQGCIQLRLTESLVIFMQQCGRVLRPKPDGSAAVILDHVGNIHRHGMPDADRVWTLQGAPKRQHAAALRTCPKCYLVHAPAPACPQCGELYEASNKRKLAKSVEGALAEVDGAAAPVPLTLRELVKKAKSLSELKAIGRERGYKPNWAAATWARSGARFHKAKSHRRA